MPTLVTPEPTPRARALGTPAKRRSSRKVKLIDQVATQVIRGGGVLVIAAVAAIFVFIGKEALPLFLPASATASPEALVPASAVANGPSLLGTDEYESYAYWLNADGAIELADLPDWKPHAVLTISELDGQTVSSTYRSPSKDYLFLGTKEGSVLLTQMKFRPVYSEAGREVEARLGEGKLVEVSPQQSPIVQVFGRLSSSGVIHFAARSEDGNIYVGSYEEGDDPKVESVEGLPDASVTALALDGEGEKLFASTADGKLYHWVATEDLSQPFEVINVSDSANPVTAMEFLMGDSSLVLGYREGSVEQWFGVRDQEGQVFRPFRKIRAFEPLPAPVDHLIVSGRNKGFLAASEHGEMKLYFATSARTLLELNTGNPLRDVVYSPKLTSITALTREGRAHHWEVDNAHPEISLGTLFGKVWYEGYDHPDYVWQSTGGSDDFEPKLSLVPLTLGTLKGAFYGLLFAIPIAVLAAIYTSQFMGHRLRAVIKPAVEIMAALPSVVIGFLAGLWLAPILERHVLSVVSLFAILPVLVLSGVLAWNSLSLRQRSRMPLGAELMMIIGLVILGFLLAMQVGPWIEGLFFNGDLRQWVFQATGHQFEQRNSIVIGFAMGFAVIPIIFTISEDALSNVPQHFVSGSLALGASRWQTAMRVILPTASPGIFSAIMVGFGRAVGETMIVLMATGNTPILSFSPFNGMRTLAANIAVEIPEAPVAGTLYRILFLTAILLFLLTFVVNTVAEIVRQRLREKYKSV